MHKKTDYTKDFTGPETEEEPKADWQPNRISDTKVESEFRSKAQARQSTADCFVHPKTTQIHVEGGRDSRAIRNGERRSYSRQELERNTRLIIKFKYYRDCIWSRIPVQNQDWPLYVCLVKNVCAKPIYAES